MSKRTLTENEEMQAPIEEDLEELADAQEMTSDDIGFIIDSDGNLKTVFGNLEAFECPPDTVAQILELFGIDGMDVLRQNMTFH